jgi:nucleoside-triphosphatase THEP1
LNSLDRERCGICDLEAIIIEKKMTYRVETFTTDALVHDRKVVGFEIQSLQSASRGKLKKNYAFTLIFTTKNGEISVETENLNKTSLITQQTE